MPKNVTLEIWGRAHFDPPPSLWTLRQMVRAGKIEPPPARLHQRPEPLRATIPYFGHASTSPACLSWHSR